MEDPSSNTCNITHDYEFQVTTTKEDGSTIEDYPLIYYKYERINYVGMYFIVFNFSDPDGLYHGKMTVEYSPGNTFNSETSSFQIYSFTDCESMYNSINITMVDPLPSVYLLFENTAPTVVSWEMIKNLTQCTEVVDLQIQVRDGVDGEWFNINDHQIGQVASFAPYPDNTVLSWQLFDDPANTPETYFPLKGSY